MACKNEDRDRKIDVSKMMIDCVVFNNRVSKKFGVIKIEKLFVVVFVVGCVCVEGIKNSEWWQ